MSETIIKEIKHILITELGVDAKADEIDIEDGLQVKLGLDSVGFIELRFQCEQRFGIKINDEYFIPQNFSNLKSLATLITQLQENHAVI